MSRSLEPNGTELTQSGLSLYQSYVQEELLKRAAGGRQPILNPRPASPRLRSPRRQGGINTPWHVPGGVMLPGNTMYARLPTESPAEEDAGGRRYAFESQEALVEGADEFSQFEKIKLEGGWLSFVVSGWFQAVAAVVILGNSFMIFMEASNPAMEDNLYIPEQLTLCFYVFELVFRIALFKSSFLCGPLSNVAWNLLDLVVVCGGIVQQWLLPLLQITLESESVFMVIQLLRVVRVFRLIRLLLEADLSWTDDPPFQSFIGGVIAFNSLLMGAETDYKWVGFAYIEHVLLLIYCFEMAVRLKKDKFNFFCNQDLMWNWLDFTIVASSVTDQWLTPIVVLLTKEDGKAPKKSAMGKGMMFLRMLRLMRILRLVRLVKSVRPLYDMVMGVTAAVQGVFWVLILTLVVLYASGIIATQLIGHGMMFGKRKDEVDPAIMAPFASVGDSMFMLFKVMAGTPSSDDSIAINALMGTVPAAKFVFVWFMVTSSWTLLSILTAVVSENMISTTNDQKVLLQLQNADEDRQDHAEQLKDLFTQIDADGSGSLDPEEVEQFLNDPKHRADCAVTCNMPARDISYIFAILSENGKKHVAMDQFVEVLTGVGEPTTGKSVMKLEERLDTHLMKIEAHMRALETKIEAKLTSMERKVGGQPNHDSSPAKRSQRDQETFNSAVMEKLDSLHAALWKGSRDMVDELAKKQEQWQHQLSTQMSGIGGRLNALEKQEKAQADHLGDVVQALETNVSTSMVKLQERISSLEMQSKSTTLEDTAGRQKNGMHPSRSVEVDDPQSVAEKVLQVRKELKRLSDVAQFRNEELQSQLRNIAYSSESQRQSIREQEAFHGAVMEKFDAHQMAIWKGSRATVEELAKRQEQWQQHMSHQMSGIGGRLNGLEKKMEKLVSHLLQQINILSHSKGDAASANGVEGLHIFSGENPFAIGDNHWQTSNGPGARAGDDFASTDVEVSAEDKTYMSQVVGSRSERMFENSASGP